MLGSPYLLPGFVMALVMCSNRSYFQAICFMIGVVYCADDTTFFVMLFAALVWIAYSHIRAAYSGE